MSGTVRRLVVEIPKGFMNCAVTKSNQFTADTNDSTHWDSLAFPLPEGKWSIFSQNEKVVVLIEKAEK